MNDSFRIQLRIDDKPYPLKCRRDEEKIFRSAASLINDKLRQYRNKYHGAPIDNKDFVIMVACDIASSQIRFLDQQNETPAYKKMEELTAELERFIDSELKY